MLRKLKEPSSQEGATRPTIAIDMSPRRLTDPAPPLPAPWVFSRPIGKVNLDRRLELEEERAPRVPKLSYEVPAMASASTTYVGCTSPRHEASDFVSKFASPRGVHFELPASRPHDAMAKAPTGSHSLRLAAQSVGQPTAQRAGAGALPVNSWLRNPSAKSPTRQHEPSITSEAAPVGTSARYPYGRSDLSPRYHVRRWPLTSARDRSQH